MNGATMEKPATAWNSIGDIAVVDGEGGVPSAGGLGGTDGVAGQAASGGAADRWWCVRALPSGPLVCGPRLSLPDFRG